MAMAVGKYDALLFTEYGLYPPKLEPWHVWHDRMCTAIKGSYICFSYNTNDREDTKWNQDGGTCSTLTADMQSRMTEKGSGGDPIKLGRWTWVCIGGKDDITTVFVSAYWPCKSLNGLNTVWNQQVRYFKREEDIEVPNIQAFFNRNMYKALDDIKDKRYHVVLEMDANNDVCDGEVSKSLLAIDISQAVISSHGGRSASVTCATNTQRKPINSIWTSPRLTVLKFEFLQFHEVYGFNSDHWLICAKICYTNFYGHHPQRVSRAPVSKVKSNDPDIRGKWIQKCIQR